MPWHRKWYNSPAQRKNPIEQLIHQLRVLSRESILLLLTEPPNPSVFPSQVHVTLAAWSLPSATTVSDDWALNLSSSLTSYNFFGGLKKGGNLLGAAWCDLDKPMRRQMFKAEVRVSMASMILGVGKSMGNNGSLLIFTSDYRGFLEHLQHVLIITDSVIWCVTQNSLYMMT